MIAVDTYSDFERLDGFRDRWDRLWSLTPDATFTQTYNHYRAATEAAGAAPRVFAASVSGRLVGLWAMCEHRSRSGLRRRRILNCAGIDLAAPCLIGPSPAATAAVLARHFRGSREWDSLDFAASLQTRTLVAGFEAAGHSCSVQPGPTLVEVRLGGRWAEVRDCCDETTRLAAYRAQHASADDDFRFERLRPTGPEPARAAIEDALGASDTLAADERLRLSATFEQASRRGAADIVVLRQGGRVVAASLSFVTAGDLESRFAAVARGAPPFAGVRLFVDLFRDGLARGDRKFVYAATPGHPANGWGKAVARRHVVRVDLGRGAVAGFRRIGRNLRRAALGAAG